MNFENFDFIDFGCSAGGNVEFVNRILPDAKGLGIDIDPKKVEAARARGVEAIILDILTIESQKLVEFVTMSHFLEHLDNPREAEKFIRKAVDISRSFVHIRQPFFDADGYLLEQGQTGLSVAGCVVAVVTRRCWRNMPWLQWMVTHATSTTTTTTEHL